MAGLKEPSFLTRARDEVSLFVKIVHIMRKHDPDVLLGFNTEKESWGYLVKRAELLGFPLSGLLSRTPPFLASINESLYRQRKRDFVPNLKMLSPGP